MKGEFQLANSDVRAIVRMIGEVATVRGSLTEKRRFLMERVCEYLQADAWAWGHAAKMEPGELPVYIAMLNGGFSERQWADFLKVQTHPEMAAISAPVAQALKVHRRHTTRTLQDLIDIPDFLQLEVARLWQISGFYPLFISFYPLANGILSGVALYRKCGGPWATERETRIFHVLASEISWLHTHESSDEVLAEVPRLALRQRLALELLLNGHSRKSIASHMEISLGTASGYVRDLYRVFHVTSQSQLVRRFFRGDGGDAS